MHEYPGAQKETSIRKQDIVSNRVNATIQAHFKCICCISNGLIFPLSMLSGVRPANCVVAHNDAVRLYLSRILTASVFVSRQALDVKKE